MVRKGGLLAYTLNGNFGSDVKVILNETLLPLVSPDLYQIRIISLHRIR